MGEVGGRGEGMCGNLFNLFSFFSFFSGGGFNFFKIILM